MHIELENPKALAAAIAALAHIAEARQTLPILSHLLLEADQGLTLTATDLTTSLRLAIPAEVPNAGSVAVPVRPLKSIGLFPNAPVSLHLTAPDDPDAGKTFIVTCGTGRLELRTLPASEFPTIVPMVEASVQIPAAIFATLLHKTCFAVCQTPDRPALTGLHMITRQGRLEFTATDGHRAVRATTPTTGTLPGIIIPEKCLLALTALAIEGDVELGVDDAHALLHVRRGPTCHLTVRRIDATFPDVDQVFSPIDTLHQITVSRTELREALHHIRPLADNRRAVDLKTTAHALTLHADDGSDEATDSIEATVSGNPPPIGFNSRYLLDLLDAVDAEQVRLTISDTMGAARLEPVDDPTFSHVVMPMRK